MYTLRNGTGWGGVFVPLQALALVYYYCWNLLSFKVISHILSLANQIGGFETEDLQEKYVVIHKQNLTFPLVVQVGLEPTVVDRAVKQ